MDMCRALQRHAIHTLVATTDANGSDRLKVPLETPTLHHGQETIFFRCQWSEAFKYSRPLAQWLHENVRGFDLVHIHAIFSHASLAAGRAAFRANVPYLVRPLGSLAPWALRHHAWRKHVLWRWAVKRFLRNAAAIHCTSDAEKQQVERVLDRCNAQVIPLGIELAPLDGSRRVTDETRPSVLSLGRLHPVKGLDILIASFSKVAQEEPYRNWELVIAGDGEARYVSRLKRLAANSGVAQRIHFPGWLQGMQKEQAFKNADLLAVPSHQENFGLSIIEALSLGTSVIVSHCVDLAEPIDRAAAGWVCDLSVEALSTALRDAMSQKEERRRRGLSGRRMVETNFAWPIVTANLLELYHSLACNKRPS